MLTHIKDNRNTFTVVMDNKSYQFDTTHPNYIDLVECVKCGDGSEFLRCFDSGTQIEDWSEGNFSFENGLLTYDCFGNGQKEQVHDVITNRIIDMIKGGFDFNPMLKFLERLYRNPSYRAINELYAFLEHKFLPITPDGYFLAYKAVKSDFSDKYSGKFDNSVGKVVEMPRHGVDDNCNVGCSKGLHVGAIDYVKSYGGPGDKVVICKVDPADVVSVPLDSEHQKVRCCRYEVVGEYDGDLIPAVVNDYTNDYTLEEFQEFYDEPSYDEDDDDDDY